MILCGFQVQLSPPEMSHFTQIHLSYHKVFGALVAEVESDKLLHFWDREAISRRVSSQSKNKNLKSSQSKRHIFALR
jgi:hypothetical protein